MQTEWRYPREKMVDWHPASVFMLDALRKRLFNEAAEHLGCPPEQVEIHNDLETGDLIGRRLSERAA